MWLPFASGAVVLLMVASDPDGGRTAASADLASLFALVVGTNVSPDPELKDLRYADDDAVQNASLLSQVGATVVLLTSLDNESSQIYQGLKTTAPTRRALDAAMATLNEGMRRSKESGRQPVFYFFYSGHGNVENNEGYVALHASRFWRSDLLALLRTSEAVTNHVLVDACSSYFLAFSRGKIGARSPISGHFVLAEEELPANTGVLLSTSSAVDSHEWEAFQGGVFSHEARSALRGAADLDLDRIITYEEASAFIWAANADVPNPRFRPRFFAQAPRQQRSPGAPLLDIGGATGFGRTDQLTVGPGLDDHLYVEDERGTRLLDLRPGRRQRVDLVLPTERPLFVRYVDSDAEVTLPPGDRLELAMLPMAHVQAAKRGAEQVAFRRLFQRPFTLDAVTDFRNRPPEIAEDAVRAADPSLNWLRYSLGAWGLGAGVAGGILTLLAASERGSVTDATSGVDRDRVNDRIDTFNTVAVICYAAAGAGLASYFAWTFWPESEVRIELLPTTSPSARLSVSF